MVTDIPSQEGREDLPRELVFALEPRETDPAPVCDTVERGKPHRTDLYHGHYVTRTGNPRNKRYSGDTIPPNPKLFLLTQVCHQNTFSIKARSAHTVLINVHRGLCPAVYFSSTTPDLVIGAKRV